MTTITRNIRVKTREVEKLWFTRKEAAKYIGTSVDFIKALNDKAVLGFSKVGGLVFISKSELDKLLTKNKVI